MTDEQPKLPDTSQDSNTVYTTKAFANDDGQRDVNCCNFSQNGKLVENINSFFNSVGEQSKATSTNEEFEYWFHGTDSFSANKISKFGIDIQKGAKKKDFSDGNGFYLSNDINPCTEWAEKRFVANYSAVLRYKIPKDLLAKMNDGITLRKNNKDEMKQWREIIRFNRSAKQEATRKLKNLLRSTSFIMGPLSDDGLWEQNQKNENWPKPLKNSWTQLCVCDASLADNFNLFLDKIAFIKKNDDKPIAKSEAGR